MTATASSSGARLAELPVLRRIIYSQCWEDPASAAAALSLTPEDDLLVIASAGDNALALSLEAPRSITAVDFNPSQLHLTALKIAAARALPYEGFVSFLGVRPAASRLEQYTTLRPLLSAAARRFWDAHPALIDGGVIHCGRFERYLRIFQRFILPLTHSRAEVERLLSLQTLAEQESYFAAVWDNRRWRLLLRFFFGRLLQGRLGRHPAFLKYAPIDDIGAHYARRARHGLTRIPIRDNYFVEYMLTGGYASEERLPPYLQRRNFERLRAGLDRIALVEAPVVERLRAGPAAAYTKLYLSDVFEWMSDAECEAAFAAISRAARRPAVLCYYNNLVPRSAPAALSDDFVADEALGAALHERDRSFVYRAFRVERLL